MVLGYAEGSMLYWELTQQCCVHFIVLEGEGWCIGPATNMRNIPEAHHHYTAVPEVIVLWHRHCSLLAHMDLLPEFDASTTRRDTLQPQRSPVLPYFRTLSLFLFLF